MQTFLPYPLFAQSVSCLDNKRLGKQRVEAFQILNILEKIKQNKIYKIKNGKKIKIGWVNHPAVKMWKNSEQALKLYLNCCIFEWKKRGFKNNLKVSRIKEEVIFPSWLGNEEFHASHKSNLLRKNFDFYKQFNWKESSNLSYIWPENT